MVTRTPVEVGTVGQSECELCRLVVASGDFPAVVDSQIAIHVDDDLIVFMRPPSMTIAVAPAQHVQAISELDTAALGRFLAGLRQVSLRIGAAFGSAGPTIDPFQSSSAGVEGGHVSFDMVIAADQGSSVARSTSPMLRAQLLAAQFR
jgi:diadenosine tetraphosphate (Ap4A) HIT family hydrolase